MRNVEILQELTFFDWTLTITGRLASPPRRNSVANNDLWIRGINRLFTGYYRWVGMPDRQFYTEFNLTRGAASEDCSNNMV